MLYDVTKTTQEQTRNFLIISLTIITLLFSILAFVRYHNIRSSIIEQIPIDELKQKVILKAQQEIDEITQTKTRIETIENKIQKDLLSFSDKTLKTDKQIVALSDIVDKASEEIKEISKSIKRIESIEKQIKIELAELSKKAEKTDIVVESILKAVDTYQEQANDLKAKTQQLIIESESIKESLSEDQQEEIRRKMQNKYFSLFSLSTRTISIVLSEFLGIKNELSSLSQNIVGALQSRFRIVSDGRIGSATALMISVQAYYLNPKIVKKDLVDAKFHRDKNLPIVFSAMYHEDKRYFMEMYDNQQHRLHKSLLNVLDHSGIDKKIFEEALNLQFRFLMYLTVFLILLYCRYDW